MSDTLIFPMGKFDARIPTDRMYADNHHWLQEAAGGFRVGFSAYAVRLLQDVYFLEWSVDAGARVRKKQEIGQIESSKAVSSLFPPVDGVLVGFNEQLLDDPTPINTDGYGAGWLYTLETSARAMTAHEYVTFLETKWDETQRMIKGQLND
jgi:glycine cleavage system H protein